MTEREAKAERRRVRHKLRSMPIEDLKDLLNRSKLEKELGTLIDNDISPGRVWMSSVGKTIATNTAKTAGTAMATYTIASWMKAKGSDAKLKDTFNFTELAPLVINQIKKK